MKKYRLIKEYPGSLKLNTIIQKQTKFSSNYMYKIDCNLFQSGVNNPEDYPEFWEEIIENDYEILSFKSAVTTYVFTEDGNYYKSQNQVTTNYHQLNFLLKNRNTYSIHSVKRLSDGEIFTVGDIDNFGKITAFVIRENKIVSQYYRIGDWQWLSSIQHIKKPLFTTEDGVDIFENDMFFTICPQFKICNCNSESQVFLVKAKGWLYFSTRKAAEEYILMNKPSLSVNDIGKVLWIDSPKRKRIDCNILIESLKEFIKNKK